MTAMTAALIAAAISLSSCRKAPEPALQRIALLPFENLTGDQAFDWLATAAPALVSNQLTGIPKTVAVIGGAMRDAYAQGATRAVHGYFTKRGSELHVVAVVEDLSTHKNAQQYAADGSILTTMSGLARSIDPAARPFPLEDPAVVEAWIMAMRAHTGFEQVAARAPDFGLLYVTWVESLVARNDRAGAARVVDQALGRPTLRGDIDRLRLELIRADLNSDVAARADAFTRFAKVAPNDLNVVRGAADANFRARRFAAAIENFREVIRLEPANYAAHNLIGYSQALSGDLAGAKRTIEDYSRDPGQEANGLDSLAEVHFYHGKFADAERYFLQSYQKNSANAYALYKAALAHWLGGDVAGADALHQRYVDSRPKQVNPAQTLGPTELLRAQWEWSTGRADSARRRLANRPEYGAQLLLWNALEKNEPANLPAPYALLAAKRFEDALPIWKKAYELSDPSLDALQRTMYAWCLRETGHTAELKELLRYYPIPQPTDGIFATLVYPKFVELRK